MGAALGLGCHSNYVSVQMHSRGKKTMKHVVHSDLRQTRRKVLRLLLCRWGSKARLSVKNWCLYYVCEVSRWVPL